MSAELLQKSYTYRPAKWPCPVNLARNWQAEILRVNWWWCRIAKQHVGVIKRGGGEDTGDAYRRSSVYHYCDGGTYQHTNDA